ncbi:Uncharacterised protein [Vibrio cholerae]|nr:Uncharacterised protein [Vibrio cholerae]CSI95145.1 Uncharacterised protein [Vibrio cholerae]
MIEEGLATNKGIKTATFLTGILQLFNQAI